MDNKFDLSVDYYVFRAYTLYVQSIAILNVLFKYIGGNFLLESAAEDGTPIPEPVIRARAADRI